jgi:hypothetical protein
VLSDCLFVVSSLVCVFGWSAQMMGHMAFRADSKRHSVAAEVRSNDRP